MKAIIVAAGQGTRLRPLTDDRPKCMVEYKGKTIIKYIIECMKASDLNDIVVVDGYKKEILEDYLKNDNIKFVTNEKYDVTNMVSTLFCAEEEMDDDIIISYADIIYTEKVLKSLMDSKDDISVVVDKEWKKLWLKRMDNPLEDAETMKIGEKGNIVELGKKAKSYDEIEGQYIGLIKISKDAIKKVRAFYHSLDKDAIYDGKTFDNMFMTSFIQKMINELMDVKPVFINGGWLEIDSVEDLESYDDYILE